MYSNALQSKMSTPGRFFCYDHGWLMGPTEYLEAYKHNGYGIYFPIGFISDHDLRKVESNNVDTTGLGAPPSQQSASTTSSTKPTCLPRTRSGVINAPDWMDRFFSNPWDVVEDPLETAIDLLKEAYHG
ncbi:unnamed protein product, partial [Amoebophrya sp. A25]|eukprot:GSA25T00017440001.1